MNLSITIWSLILLFSSFQAVVLTVIILFQHHGNRPSKFVLAILLSIISIILFDHRLRLSELYKSFPYGLYTSDALWYLVAPLIWMYFKIRIGNKQLRWIDSLHVMPFLAFAFLYRQLPFAPANFKTQILEAYLNNNSMYSMPVKIFILIMMIQMLAYLSVSLWGLIKYEKQFRQNASGNELNHIIKLKGVVFLFTLYFLFEFSFSTYRNFINTPNKFIENWSLVVWSLFILTLTYVIANKPEYIFSRISPIQSKKKVISDVDIIQTRLLAYMSTSKPFLNNGLTLPELAEAIASSPHQLSYLLNTTMGISFYDFVNTYRVQHTAKQFQTGELKKLSIFGVAQASGFKSKASFYTFFKKEFNQTPKKYIESLSPSQSLEF